MKLGFGLKFNHKVNMLVPVRVLQRNRTNRRGCVCVCLKEIYYKKMTHSITQVGKSPDLQGVKD